MESSCDWYPCNSAGRFICARVGALDRSGAVSECNACSDVFFCRVRAESRSNRGNGASCHGGVEWQI